MQKLRARMTSVPVAFYLANSALPSYAGCIFMDKSTALTECVSAPTEI